MKLNLRRLCPLVAIWTLFLILAAGQAASAAEQYNAQQLPSNPWAAEHLRTDTLRLKLNIAAVDMAEIKNGPAEMGYTEVRLYGRYRGFDMGYELRDYRWSRGNGFPFSSISDDPFNKMHTVWAGYEHRGRIDRRWSLRLSGRVTSAFEDDILGSPTLLGMAGVNYNRSKDWVISAGLLGLYNEADKMALPYVSLTYRPWARHGFSGSLGFPFTRLNYHFNQMFSLTLRGGYMRRTYKLADDNPVRPSGEFRTKEFVGGLSLNVNFNPNWRGEIGFNYLFQREITFFDDGGDRGSDYDLENTFAGILRLTYKF